jgi:hypothetical protein
MAKKDFEEKLEELDDWKRKKEIEDGIREGLTKWLRTICISATSAALGCCYWLGGLIYQKWDPLQAAVKAFLAADRGS